MIMPNTPDDSLIRDLMTTLTLTEITLDVFSAPSFDYVGARVFGGQVLAQAMMAGAKTLQIDKPCHSFHGYFFAWGRHSPASHLPSSPFA